MSAATPISELSIPARARNALVRDGVRTVADFLALSDAEMLRIPEFGKVGLRETKIAIFERFPDLRKSGAVKAAKIMNDFASRYPGVSMPLAGWRYLEGLIEAAVNE